MKLNKNTYQLTYSSIVAAILILMMITIRLLPTADLFINFLMSLSMSVAVIEVGKRKSFLLYITVSMLSFFWPGPPFNLGFIIVGGLYPYFKIITEQESMGRRYGRTASLVIKLSIGVLLAVLYGLVISRVFLPLPVWDRVMALPLAKLWILPLAFLIILIYDFLLSQGIDFYFQRLAPLIKKRHLP